VRDSALEGAAGCRAPLEAGVEAPADPPGAGGMERRPDSHITGLGGPAAGSIPQPARPAGTYPAASGCAGREP
jgi:hypothetical protein